MTVSSKTILDSLAGKCDAETDGVVAREFEIPESLARRTLKAITGQAEHLLNQLRHSQQAAPLSLRESAHPSRLAWWLTGVVGAAAAIFAGVYVGAVFSSRVRGETMLADILPRSSHSRGVNTSESTPRGPDGTYKIAAAEFELVIRSPRNGFATLVRIAHGEREVYPTADQQHIEMHAHEPRVYGPLEVSADRSILLVFITERPAMETIKVAVADESVRATSIDELMLHVQGNLWSAGHRWVAVGVVMVQSFQKE